jgi:hypothetical protein
MAEITGTCPECGIKERVDADGNIADHERARTTYTVGRQDLSPCPGTGKLPLEGFIGPF